MLALHRCFHCLIISSPWRGLPRVSSETGDNVHMKPGRHLFSGTHTSMPGERSTFFIFYHSHLQMSSLWCVLNIAKGTVGSLYLFPVWSWWRCCCFSHSNSRNLGSGMLEGETGVISIMHLFSLMPNCLVQQMRFTRAYALSCLRLL